MHRAARRGRTARARHGRRAARRAERLLGRGHARLRAPRLDAPAEADAPPTRGGILRLRGAELGGGLGPGGVEARWANAPLDILAVGEAWLEVAVPSGLPSPATLAVAHVVRAPSGQEVQRVHSAAVAIAYAPPRLDAVTVLRARTDAAQVGAWGCFDEFNRINIEVLSVVSAQLRSIQNALIYDNPTCDIGNGDISVKRVAGFATCGFFITMNPGYAGRTELPDNLKALFRPVTMTDPWEATSLVLPATTTAFFALVRLDSPATMTECVLAAVLSSPPRIDANSPV